MEIRTEAIRRGAVSAPSPRINWRMVMLGTGVAIFLVIAVAMVLVNRLIPPVVVIGLLYLMGLGLTRRRARLSAVCMAVPSVLLIVRHLPLLAGALATPTATFEFMTTGATVTLAVANLTAAVGVMRERESGMAASLVALTTGAILVAIVLVALLA